MNSPEKQSSQTDPNANDELGFDLPPPAHVSKTRVVVIGVVMASVLGVAFVIGYLPRLHARKELEQESHAAEGAKVRVDVVSPTVVSSDRAMVLTGSILPLQETTLYPRANGYVRDWLVDIGDKVKEGQVLAEIDTPELDQDLLQARAVLAQAQANLVQAQANRDLSKTNQARTEKLVASGISSQQDLDQRVGQAAVDEANVKVAQAAIAAQEANIRRSTDLKAFAHVIAPFSGTITMRTIERGALVTAGNTNPLYKLAETDPVRVLLAVPQDVAPSVRDGADAAVTVREFAGQKFAGKVARSSGALDTATRTMNTEVRVPNSDGKLLSGMFVEVALTLPSPHRVLEVPSTVLYSDAKGLRVAVVGPDDTIHFAKVTVERDTGPTLQISTGIDPADRIVKLANASLKDGQPVEVAH